MKKYLLWGLGIIILLAVVWLAFLPPGKNFLPGPPPTPTPQQLAPPPPSVERVPGAPKVVLFTYDGPQPTLPLSLPVYRFLWSAKPDELPQVQKLAGDLGFVKQPTVTNDSSQFQTVWNGTSGEYLEYNLYQKTKTLTFQVKKPLPPTANQKDVSQSVTDFVKASFYSPTPNLRLVSTGTTGSENALFPNSLPDYSFSLLSPNGYPLVLANYNTVAAYAVIDSNGSIWALNYVFPPNLNQEGPAVKTLSLQEALDGLNSGKGLLLSALEGQNWGFVTNFSGVSLTSMVVAYLVDYDGLIARPVYIFKGAAVTTDQKVVDVEYLLYASANP